MEQFPVMIFLGSDGLWSVCAAGEVFGRFGRDSIEGTDSTLEGAAQRFRAAIKIELDRHVSKEQKGGL